MTLLRPWYHHLRCPANDLNCDRTEWLRTHTLSGSTQDHFWSRGVSTAVVHQMPDNFDTAPMFSLRVTMGPRRTLSVVAQVEMSPQLNKFDAAEWVMFFTTAPAQHDRENMNGNPPRIVVRGGTNVVPGRQTCPRAEIRAAAIAILAARCGPLKVSSHHACVVARTCKNDDTAD